MWFIIACGLLVVLVYFKLVKVNSFWEERGVPFVKPWLLFGNMASGVFRTRAFTHILQDIYKSHPKERYIGFYQFIQPALMLRDPDLIKQITVKDFDVFPDHINFAPADADPLWGKNLFEMTSKNGWQDMRSTLSPSFTSSKMRIMFTLMEQCSKQFINYFKNQPGTVSVELKDAFTRYTNDVIGTTAFGLTCDSLEDKNNKFYSVGKDVTNFSGLRGLKFVGYAFIPFLMKLFDVKLISNENATFLRSLIKETISVREEKQIIRPDMVHLLMEAKKGRGKHDNENNVIDTGFAVAEESEIGKTQKKQKPEITDEDITAQALIFFLAGFDTASTLMCYVAYELAINPDVQQTLREEIDRVAEECNGKITYEALLGMKYLDNVVTEALRLHPPAVFITRTSVRPYTIQPEKPGEKALHLNAGSNVWIPVYAIHRDATHYLDPDKFIPERFSDENKHHIKPYTYLSFGAGPRNCIGSRFALLETKLITVGLLQNFQLVPVEKTPVPLKLSLSDPTPMPEGGFWLGLKSR